MIAKIVNSNDLKEIIMDLDSEATAEKNIRELKNDYEDLNNGSNQDVIVVDGRGYEKNGNNKRKVYTLVDVIEDTETANSLNEEIIRRATDIIERIARETVPEIAEKVIKEEIEKLKKLYGSD